MRFRCHLGKRPSRLDRGAAPKSGAAKGKAVTGYSFPVGKAVREKREGKAVTGYSFPEERWEKR
jgi:hypothetical protein